MNDWGIAPVIPVSLLVSSARLLIERHLGLAWISGEVSNCTRAASGHTYFVLKDDRAQVRCVLFRMKAQLLDFTLGDGQQVEVRAVPTIYEARGEFQLSVETVRLSGLGALYERRCGDRGYRGTPPHQDQSDGRTGKNEAYCATHYSRRAA